MLVNLFEPVLNVVECLLVCAIINQNNTHSTLIISLCNCSESLLACSIPNLKFNSFIIHIDFLDLKINTYKLIITHLFNKNIKLYSNKLNLPMVGIWDTGKESSEKRRSKQVLPTEESPIIISLSK